jgi:hypothetical protein
MRVLVALLASLCVVGACRVMPSLSHQPSPAPQITGDGLAACPEGLPSQPGLTDFGAYIGTWQANHYRIPQTSEYAIALDLGRVGVGCSAAGYVIAEDFTMTFQVPGGRALQFALTDLPIDSRQIFDHTHPACRSLQYQSDSIARQLGTDDRPGLVDITLRSPSREYNRSAVSMAEIRVATALGDDSSPC